MNNLINQVGYWRVCQDAGRPVRECSECPLNRASGFVNERDPGDITAQEPLSVCEVLTELNEISTVVKEED